MDNLEGKVSELADRAGVKTLVSGFNAPVVLVEVCEKLLTRIETMENTFADNGIELVPKLPPAG